MASALAQTQVGMEDASRMGSKLKRYLDRFAAVGGGKSGTQPGFVPREDLRWNKIQSELEEQLRQARGNSIPEQYRRAIEQYFEIIVAQ